MTGERRGHRPPGAAEEYRDFLATVEDGPTPRLADYLRWEEYDDNLPWRVGLGHLVNLLDQAVEEIEQAEARLRAVEDLAAMWSSLPNLPDDEVPKAYATARWYAPTFAEDLRDELDQAPPDRP